MSLFFILMNFAFLREKKIFKLNLGSALELFYNILNILCINSCLLNGEM